MDKNSFLPALQHRFDTPVWKIEVDSDEQLVAIENRDATSHTATFSLFSYETGECFFSGKQVENSWWHGLDKVVGGIVLLHGYESEERPQRKGIIALDRAGEVRWRHYNLAIESVSRSGLLVYYTAMQPRRLHLADVHTGEVKATTTTGHSALWQDIAIPTIFPASGVRPDHIPDTIEGQLLFLASGATVCWSFHTREGALADQHLIVERDGEVIFHDFLARGIQKLHPEAFFLSSGYLIYIKDQVEIVSYLL